MKILAIFVGCIEGNNTDVNIKTADKKVI